MLPKRKKKYSTLKELKNVKNILKIEILKYSSNMATATSDFEPWLTEKLRSLKTDEGVFGSYISGILESEDSVDEKKDALEGILSEIVVSLPVVFGL